MEEKLEPRKKPTNIQTTNLQFSFLGLAEEALQIAVKRREVKSKGEKERYTHLNAEFQRRSRRDKKAFLNDQCKEIEENNGMRKAFLSLLAVLWNSAFRCLYLSFSLLLFTSLLFTAICKASPDSHFAFLHFFSMGMVLIPVSCTMS